MPDDAHAALKVSAAVICKKTKVNDNAPYSCRRMNSHSKVLSPVKNKSSFQHYAQNQGEKFQVPVPLLRSINPFMHHSLSMFFPLLPLNFSWFVVKVHVHACRTLIEGIAGRRLV